MTYLLFVCTQTRGVLVTEHNKKALDQVCTQIEVYCACVVLVLCPTQQEGLRSATHVETSVLYVAWAMYYVILCIQVHILQQEHIL